MTNNEKWDNIYRLIHWLRDALSNDLPASREQALALTKLDECEMWAEKIGRVE